MGHPVFVAGLKGKEDQREDEAGDEQRCDDALIAVVHVGHDDAGDGGGEEADGDDEEEDLQRKMGFLFGRCGGSSRGPWTGVGFGCGSGSCVGDRGRSAWRGSGVGVFALVLAQVRGSVGGTGSGGFGVRGLSVAEFAVAGALPAGWQFMQRALISTL